MGNLCSKSANQSDNFSSPGRVLGGAAADQGRTTAPVPAKITASTPGRTLGSSQNPGGQEDARSAAAKAAEVSAMIVVLSVSVSLASS